MSPAVEGALLSALGGDRLPLIRAVRILYADPGAFVRQCRARLEAGHVTQAELARRAGISAPNLSKTLMLHEAPQLERMMLLDEALAEIEADRAAGRPPVRGPRPLFAGEGRGLNV